MFKRKFYVVIYRVESRVLALYPHANYEGGNAIERISNDSFEVRLRFTAEARTMWGFVRLFEKWAAEISHYRTKPKIEKVTTLSKFALDSSKAT